MTSFQRRCHNYVTEKIIKITLQNFSILNPSQSKFLTTLIFERAL